MEFIIQKPKSGDLLKCLDGWMDTLLTLCRFVWHWWHFQNFIDRLRNSCNNYYNLFIVVIKESSVKYISYTPYIISYLQFKQFATHDGMYAVKKKLYILRVNEAWRCIVDGLPFVYIDRIVIEVTYNKFFFRENVVLRFCVEN